MLQPGEQATQIVLWEVDDPSKRDDPRFWWPAEPPFELPDGRPLSGPKGQSLAALRDRSGGEEIELPVPVDGRTLRLSTADWGDPDRTHVIVVHHHRPTDEERAAELARRGGEPPRFDGPGWHRPLAQPKDGVELEPGVYLLDERP